MASVQQSSLFSATAMSGRGKRPFKHRTDSEFAAEIATKQRIQGGAVSPHPKSDGSGPPVKKIK